MPTEQELAELDVEGFRANLGPFVVAAQKTRMPMVFTDVQEDKKPIIFANDSFVDLTGFSREELLGKDFFSLLVGQGNRESLAKVAAAFGKTPASDPEVSFCKKDGTEFPASFFVTPVVDEQGGKVQYFASLVDLTPARAAGAEIEFQSSLLDSVGEAVIATDLNGNIAYWNHAAEALYGWSREEVLGREVAERMQSPSGQDDGSDAVWRATKKVQSGNVVVRTRDGRTFPARVTGAPTYGREGSLTGSVYVSTDISGELHRQAELKQKNDLLEVTLENIFQGIMVADADNRIILCNPRAATLLNLPLDLFRSRPLLREAMERQVAQGEVIPSGGIEGRSFATDPPLYERTSANGTVLEVRTIRLADGGAVRTFTDITASRQAEKALRASEARLRALVTASSAVLWRATPEGMIFEIDERSGAPETWRPPLSTNWRDLPSDGERLRVETAWRAIVEAGKFKEVEFEFRCAAADKRWMCCRAVPLIGSDGMIEEWVGTLHDVHEQRESAETLLLRDRSLGAIAQGVVITDARQADNPITYVNTAFESITGFSAQESLGKNCRFLQGLRSDPQVIERIRANLTRRQVVRETLINYKKSGEPFSNELSIAPVFDDAGDLTHFVGIQSDVTASVSIAEQLRQAQKMKAIGQLTGGIAHDFNNLLTVIIGNSELLTEDLSDPALTRSLAQVILEAGERGAALTQHLLAFARRQTLTPERMILNEVLHGMEALLRRAIPASVEIRTEFSDGNSAALTDRTLLESAILNIVVNAKDAMPQGGTLTIKTGERTANSGEGTLPVGQPVVFVTISDTGTGMSPELLAQVFEPFFTTKEIGKGTGLGLSMAYGFAQQSAGHISIASEVGRGTSVTIVLPAIGTQASQPLDINEPILAKGGREKILVVEDEPQVLQFVLSQLIRLGYWVEAVSSGPDALDLLRRDMSFDLLFTDIVLPKGVSGVELARQAREVKPTIKVLLTSGYPEAAFEHHGRPEADMPLLRKPYKRRELADMVKAVLEPLAS